MKYSLLLLDANIVIYLHKLNLWKRFISECNVVLSRTVVREADYFISKGKKTPINLSPDEKAGRIQVVDLAASKIQAFKNKFDVINLEQLDPGEAESLAYLVDSDKVFTICSSDKIVFKALALLDRSDQGISLEEVLSGLGLGRRLQFQFTKEFREKIASRGTLDRIQGTGLK